MSKWLNPTVKAYCRYFGKTDKPVVWDVGSRDGDDGVWLAREIYRGDKDWFWSNATVVCFEPNPDQVVVIRRNYPEADIFELAASNKAGCRKFKVYHGDKGAVGSSSLNLDWKENDLEGHVIKVNTVRLDSLISDNLIDIMKVDVEGHSPEVLEGIGDKLKQIKVMHIETETWTGSDMVVQEFMKSRGWALVDIQEQWGGMPDQLWVNSVFPVD